MKLRTFILLFFFLITLYSCKKESKITTYKTENVIIIVVDGARYTETWGDSSHQNIPMMSKFMSKEGIINANFYNEGPTWTISGHTAITTGFYQEINNSGDELPAYPSVFQSWIRTHNEDSINAWVITSKDKLEILTDCQESTWKGKFRPSKNCGIAGQGTGYRHDTITQSVAKEILSDHQVNLVLINYREPDYSGHQNNWDAYIKGIKMTDSLVYDMWQFIQTNNLYKDKTTLFVTNDHGRHSDDVADGFVSHGDNCEGCTHLFFYAFGPDFKKNIIFNNKRNLTDITITVGGLLQTKIPFGNGELMTELFE